MTVMDAIDKAKKNIDAAKEAMVDGLNAAEKEIRWAITSVYNYDTQNALNKALTKARAGMDATCDTRIAALNKTLEDVRDTWQSCVTAETDSLNTNTKEESDRCEASKEANTKQLEEFKAGQLAQYEAWAAAETAALEEFVAKCAEAWEWIQVSYCLKHGTEGDVTQTGYGCSWGQGSGYGNAAFKKGIAVEAHDEVLKYGQNLDIKHIHNLDKLVKHAVEYTMAGVPEEAAKQKKEVDWAQAERQAAVKEARQALEDALNERLDQSKSDLDKKVIELGIELEDREAAAVAAVDSDRQGWEAGIDAEREKVLWDIKELVWRLGYTQGYHYGAHDGHDAELIAQITGKKEQFERVVVEALQNMHDRVIKEKADAEVAYNEARAELDALMEKLTQEMEDAIAAAKASMEETLAGAKQDEADEIQRATDALFAFIEARLADWGDKADREELNAKWQEDSYYRYNLLRLLQEKKQAITAAVAEAKADWGALMTAEKAEGVAFRGAQRDALDKATAAIRTALADAMNEDDANMEKAIAERTASLDEKLQEQQDLLNAAVEADREEMRLRLKEIYNYNNYDWDKSKIPDSSASPYSHEQHQAFLHKYAYYLKDVLRQMDAGIANMKGAYATSVANMTEESKDQNEDLQWAVTDQKDAAEKDLSRKADDLLEAYADT